jgi:TPR repeat protein
MQISEPYPNQSFCVVVAAAIGVGGQAFALDPNAGVTRESGPFDLFKFGFSAYKSGRKDEAVEAYKYAAEKGHPGARWALANMYAYGDGVVENDYEAFKIYDDIARQGVEPGSQDTGYFVNALLSLATYYQKGIPGSPVKANLGAARQLYFQAASAFGVPEAQYRLGRMILEGQGGANDIQQAKKWLNRARVSGHPAACRGSRQCGVRGGPDRARPGVHDRCARAFASLRQGLDPVNAGAGLLACGRSRPPHRHRACAGYAGQGPELREQQTAALAV